jgi:hypothetical protein
MMEIRLRKDGNPDGRQHRRYPTSEFNNQHFVRGDFSGDIPRGAIYNEMNKASSGEFAPFMKSEYGCTGNKCPKRAIQNFIEAGRMNCTILDTFVMPKARNVRAAMALVEDFVNENPYLRTAVKNRIVGSGKSGYEDEEDGGVDLLEPTHRDARDTEESSMKEWQKRKVIAFWKDKFCVGAYEDMVFAHMLPKKASGAKKADHRKSNVMLVPSELDKAVGTWNGTREGRYEVVESSKGIKGIFRYKGTDPRVLRYKDLEFDVPRGWVENLEIWNKGPQACKDALDARAVKTNKKDLTISKNPEILGVAATTA